MGERTNHMGLIAFFLVTLLIYFWLPVRGGLKTFLLVLMMVSGWLSIFELVSILEARPWIFAPILIVVASVIWKVQRDRKQQMKKSV
ncbi:MULTISPECIES: hypothetical protein [unclassified Exiguobacterium]|uniref:hypothetical protein n=1 Tax=unclassified Exiguobacterium TaxID=2644629 RepID=UPI001BEAF650|nr:MULTISPECIES: hypothetical protein [unclassified Exiguobacterium]